MPTIKKKPVARKGAVKPTRKPKPVANKATPAPTKQAAPPKPRSNQMAGMTPMEKAQAFAQFARDNEWWAGAKTIKDTGNIMVTVKRDDGRYKETITVEWSGSRVTQNGIIYTIEGQGRSLVVHNLAAARHHIDGSRMFKREVKERRKRAPRRHLRILGGDGSEFGEGEEPTRTIIGAHIIDKWYDMVVTKKKRAKGKTVTKIVARIEGLGKPQADSLTRVWEADGLEVTVKDRSVAS